MTDPLVGLTGFTEVLRRIGLGVDPVRAQAYLAALRLVDVAQPSQVYWAGRLCLCAEPDDIAGYDAAFASWFGGVPVRASGNGRARRRTATSAPLVAPVSGQGQGDAPELRVAASDTEILRQRDVTKLDGAALRELMATVDTAPPLRRGVRTRRSRRGRLDPDETLRELLRSGGEPIRLRYRRKRLRPRRLVLLIDVSGSMAPYSDALLRFAHAVVRRSPPSTEAFTLGTRLTRVSRQLRMRDPEQALAAAARAVPDFAGGTRLGDTIRLFLDRWGQRGLARQSVTVVFSDGWERGDATLLGEQLARLRRLAHAVLWVNPHVGRSGYAPVQSGIRAALPHVDRLLAGHSLATLDELLTEVRRA
ncbi:VWA domain-containing protein [Kutzneria sp. NPDC052558]|uniref:VWA domain-containing protein n=1 Tax=Kutzneria sp. NPDC052558 TaxID=3364121 RepID=UPI0037C58546